MVPAVRLTSKREVTNEAGWEVIAVGAYSGRWGGRSRPLIPGRLGDG